MTLGHLLRHLLVIPTASMPQQPASSLDTRSACCLPHSPVKMDYAVYQMPHSQRNSPPIVIMHGLNLTRAHWRRVARHLAKRGPRRVLTVDARNHGQSAHSAEHSPAHMAADVLEFMELQELRRIVALGHSMGGRAMMTLALNQPKRVERAIFVDITLEGPPPDLYLTPALFELMLEVVSTIPRELSLSEGRKFVLPHLSKLVKEEGNLKLVVFNLRKLESGEFAWAVNPQAIIDGWDETVSNFAKTLKGLKPYEGPTLLIAGKRSNFVTPAGVQQMQKYFPQLKLVELDAGHRVHHDQPDQFVDLVVDFTSS